MNERELAYYILEAIDVDQAYSHVALNKGIPSQMPKQNADFIRHLVLGVLEKRGILDYAIKQLSDKTAKRKVRQILRLALFQILFMDRTPKHAIVDEAVSLCKKIAPQNAGYVNAVLRRANPEELLIEDFSGFPLEERLEIQYSMPNWLVTRWLNRYGLDRTEQIFRELRQKPKLYMRLNPLKASLEESKLALSQTGILWRQTEFDSLVEIEDLKGVSLDQFKMLQDGVVSVQDLAAYLVGEVLKPAEGDRVLDACAAPGGKSSHVAEKQPGAQILSVDLYPAKVEKMTDGFLRRGYGNIQCEVHDSQMVNASWKDQFEYVILDAPCSGLGIISRKPELPYHKTVQDISELAALQSRLIGVQCQYVKAGGYLLYATCTIEPEENEDQVMQFLSAHSEFELCDLNDYLPRKYVHEKGWVSLLPSLIHDGFYIALLKKTLR